MTSDVDSPGAQPGDGTAAGLIAWLSWTMSSGELVEATASAMRTGCLKVIAVESDQGAVDIRAADIDNIVMRFRNKARGTMKDQTINAYEQRFRQAVDMYLKWLADDPSWRPIARSRGAGMGASKRPEKKAATSVGSASKPESILSPQSDAQAGPHLLQYPFPIRPGVQGKITLPEDLTAREAHRIANFVASLAIDDADSPRPTLESPSNDQVDRGV